MKTVITDSPTEAAAFIRAGGLVAFPTETVYGLGASVFDTGAVAKVFRAKGRPADNPLIVHVADKKQIEGLASHITESASMLIDRFFPGPLTVVLEKSASVPKSVTAGLNTVAVRMPENEIARRFIEASEAPLVAPSANLSGKPSPTSWQAVKEDLDGRIECILKGGTARFGIESTVVDCTGAFPVILRTGQVTLEQLREVVPETVQIKHSADGAARSPGLKHKHYSPNARVVILTEEAVAFESGTAFIGLNEAAGNFERVRKCGSVDEYARSIYEFFRECDRKGISTIYCEAVEESGLGVALMDRIRRAAAR